MLLGMMLVVGIIEWRTFHAEKARDALKQSVNQLRNIINENSPSQPMRRGSPGRLSVSPVAPARLRHSDHLCKGGRTFIDRWDRRVCVFRSVCYNKKELRWKYYIGEDEPPPALLFDNGTITTFPRQFSAVGLVNALSMSTWRFHWQGNMDIVVGEADQTNFLDAPVHVMLGPFGLGHFEHSLTDGAMPMFNMLRAFDLATLDAQALLMYRRELGCYRPKSVRPLRDNLLSYVRLGDTGS